MATVADVISDLTGNGFTQEELVDASRELTEYTISREKLFRRLAAIYEEDELDDILWEINRASSQQQLMAKIFGSLSAREKQCYLMHTVEVKSMGKIAKELGVSKGSVQLYINRAKSKIIAMK